MSGSFVALYGDSNYFLKYDTEVRKAYMPGTNVQGLYENFLKRFFADIKYVRPTIERFLEDQKDTKKDMPLQLFLPEITYSDSMSDSVGYPALIKIPIRPTQFHGCYVLEIPLKKAVDSNKIEELIKELTAIILKEREGSFNDVHKIVDLNNYPFPSVRIFEDKYAIQVESLYHTNNTNVGLYKKQMRIFIEKDIKPMIESLINDNSFVTEAETELVPLNMLFYEKKGEFKKDLIDFQNEIVVKQTGLSTTQYVFVSSKIKVTFVFGVKKVQKGKLWYMLNRHMEYIHIGKKRITHR